MAEPEAHKRYRIDQVVVWATDNRTHEKLEIKIEGKGTLLIEPVMRNTEFEDNKAKTFDGNQATIIMQIHNKTTQAI